MNILLVNLVQISNEMEYNYLISLRNARYLADVNLSANKIIVI
jgi:hypothetical protein